MKQKTKDKIAFTAIMSFAIAVIIIAVVAVCFPVKLSKAKLDLTEVWEAKETEKLVVSIEISDTNGKVYETSSIFVAGKSNYLTQNEYYENATIQICRYYYDKSWELSEVKLTPELKQLASSGIVGVEAVFYISEKTFLDGLTAGEYK
jgi:hypothetical protein